MEIRLLGTGSAEGWPGLFCGCAVCQRSRKIGGKNLRTRSSALIDGALKIDFPPDTLCHVHTQGLDMSRIQHLLFTHGHDDHCAGHELQYRSWMFVPEPFVDPLQILAPRTTLDKIAGQIDLTEIPLKGHCIKAWETTDFGKWRITALPAQHDPKQICFNYLIASGGRTLLYATDTGWYEKATWDYLRTVRLDGVVVEASKGPDEGGYSGHLSIPQVIRMREWMLVNDILPEAAPYVTTHHSHLSGLLHEEWEAALNPYGITVGYDGLVFTL